MAVITLLVGFIGWNGISNTGSALVEVGQVRLPSLLGLEMMSQAQTAVKSAERTLLVNEIFQDKQAVERELSNIEKAWKRIEEGRGIYEPLPQTTEETVLWEKFKPAWEDWKKDHLLFIEHIKAGKRELALELATTKHRQSYYRVDKLFTELIELQIKESDSFIRRSIGDVDRPKLIMGITMGTGTAIAILLGFWLSVAIGGALRRVIDGLSEGAEQIAAASSQVSSSSQQLAAGASEQAAAIEETSSSLEEMASMTKQNAENAVQANQLMSEAKEVVSSTNRSMAELTSSMNEICKASEETQRIVKTIDEISFQTNLLALNAAVEAARAGEAGAGFAVVANEVRNLAMRAAEAAKNTADLIEGTVGKIKEGSEMVLRTNSEFGRVSETVVKSGELVGEIAAASREQAQGIDQISRAVTEMDKVTQQNSANSEETASSSEEMSSQAQQMKEFVSELMQLVDGNGSGAKLIEPGFKTGRSEQPNALTAPRRQSGLSAWTAKN